MKRQANVLSAIIQNFDIVEDAIETSANSEGSALKENEKVLDSIQGRLNQFNNAVETFWNNLLDSDVIKFFVDLGTEIVKLASDFGEVRSVVFGLLMYFNMSKKYQFDLASMIFGPNGLSKILSGLGKIKKSVGEVNKIKNIPKDTSKAFKEGLEYTDSVQTGPSMFDSSSKIQNKQITMGNEQDVAKQLDIINQKAKEGQSALQDYMSITTDVDDVTKAYVETLDGQEATMSGLNKFIGEHNSKVKASGIAAKAAAVGHQLLNAAISMGISLLVSVAIEAITKYINKNKELAEATEELMDTYSSAQNTLKDHSETIADIKDDYARLAKGVDSFGNNISLSTDEFARYNEITNKIADMFPNMVTGFTEEGNAIIGLKGNVEALTKAYEEEAEAARNKVIVGAQDTLENFRNNTTKYEFWSKQRKIDKLGFFESIVKGNADIDDWVDELSTSVMDTWLEDAGINDTNWLSSSEDFDKAIKENMAQIQTYYQTLKSELDAEVQPIKTTMFAFLENDEDYNNLSDKGKQMAQSIINGFGTEFYASDEMKDKSWAEIAAWMDTNVIQKLQDTDNMEQFDTTFNLQTKFNNGDVSVDEYLKQIDALVTFLESQGFDKEVITSIKVMFDYDNLNTKMNSAKDLLDNEGDKQVGTLTDSDFEIIDKNKTKWQKEMKVDGKTTLSWDELKDKIEDAKNAAWSASEDFEKVSEEIDNIQSAYSTLSDVVTQYNKKGYLTLDNLQALLSLEPEYLSCLQMENGQLSLNQSALEALIQAKLDAAKATAVQDAITQLNTLANKTEADAIAESASAASDATSVLGGYASSLGIVAQNAIGAAGAVGAFQAALKGTQENKFVSQEDIDKVLSDFNTKINLIDSVSKNLSSNFKNIVDPNTSSKDEESALEKLQKKYERQLSNLENQKTYVQNEIDRLEAEDKGVSKSYYEKQIAIEQQKMNVYKQERAALKNLLSSTKKGTDQWYEVANAIWSAEHGIQECSTEMANLRKEIVELYQTVFDKMESAFGNIESLFSDRQSYIEKYMELLELQGNAKPASAYTDLIAQEEKKLANYEQELQNLIRIRDNAVASGYVKEGSDEWIEMTNAIREQEAAVLDSKVAIAQYNDELKQLHVEAFEMVRDAFDARADYYTAQQDYIEGYIDQLDAMNVDVPEEVYRDLIDIEKKKQENLQANIIDARQGLADLEAAGYTAVDEEWQNANNRVIEYEAQMQESITKTIEWNNSIRELDFTKFDRFVEKLEDLNSELDNVYKLTSREDVANEDGTWTEEGLTSLAMLVQQRENAINQAKYYQDEIEKLNEAYARGEMSENTYNERLKELTDGQWDAIQTGEDLKDSIIDMCEARIDLVEEGIQKEIEAYEELIELKREELESQRELYDFNKDVERQQKDIMELERKISSLSGADDAASIAEQRKLQAQLLEAREDLDSSYRNHSLDARADALDKELEAYQDASDNYIQSLRDNLEDVDSMIESVMTDVVNNADIVLQNLVKISEEYGVTLTNDLKDPWIKTSEQVALTKNDIDTMLDATEVAIGMFNASVNSTIDQMYVRMQQTSSDFTAYLSDPYNKVTASGGPINTFSTSTENALTNAVYKAQSTANEMTASNKKPWNDGVTAINTWSSSVENAYNKAIQKASEYEAAANRAQNVSGPSYYSGSSSGSGRGSGSNNNSRNNTQTKEQARKAAQNYIYNHNMREGDRARWGQDPQFKKLLDAYIKLGGSVSELKAAHGMEYYGATVKKQVNIGSKGFLDKNTATFNGVKYYYNKNLGTGYRINDLKTKSDHGSKLYYAPVGTKIYKYYAKGILGTKKDQWAITDEPQLGDELTLVPTKQGNLSYMRKGTSVVPAAITEELLKLADIGVDGLTMPKFDSGINLNIVNNAVNKPELNIDIENFLRCDNVNHDTMPELEKFVDKKMNDFMKQLNYAIRKFK